MPISIIVYIWTCSLTMSTIFMCPYAKTMAFGGVATGSMNAKLVATVTGIIKYNGWMFMFPA